jgi:hypothetical protein
VVETFDMNKSIFLALFLLIAAAVQAQNPVQWTFTSKKISDKTFEIHMSAKLQAGWHLYSQDQPEDAIAIPTGFVLNNNPLLSLDGKIKEVGDMEKFRDKKLDISANQYKDQVDFVQVVKVKVKAKTNITGVVEYQVCNDEKCLPPKKVTFSISIQ